MSYLNTPRLTFSGQFQADVSTVNNDPTHFNNETFQPEFQQFQTADALNGWWNPDGTGNWRLIGCKITSVTYRDGSTCNDPAADPVIGMSVMDTDQRTAAKLVDLDTQQQMVSEIWGMVLRIVSNDGTNILKSDYAVAPFMNIWFTRSVDKSADSAAGAIYQSVLTNLQWNEAFNKSRYLNELRATLAAGQSEALSVQFNVDRYDGNNNSPTFTLGRITGSIGPAFPKEPRQFVTGRQLFPTVSNCNYAVAVIDESSQCLVVDMGNAFQFNTGGVVHEKRDLYIAVNVSDGENTKYVSFGKLDFSAPDWYMGTSGVFNFPLDSGQLELARQFPLAVIQRITSQLDSLSSAVATTEGPVLQESVDYVRADQMVFRLNPGDTCSTVFYATHLGQPSVNAIIQVQDNTQKTLGPVPPNNPKIGTPALTFFSGQPNQTAVLKTDPDGKATLSFQVTDPGNPREYIDGQVYGLTYNLNGQNFFQDCNPANFLSLQVYSGPPANGEAPGWDNFIQPIMQQYANLYPLMSKALFNLADQKAFDSNAQILKLVFGKDPHDPNYMPATRDLSGYKRQVILDYLDSVIKSQQSETV